MLNLESLLGYLRQNEFGPLQVDHIRRFLYPQDALSYLYLPGFRVGLLMQKAAVMMIVADALGLQTVGEGYKKFCSVYDLITSQFDLAIPGATVWMIHNLGKNNLRVKRRDPRISWTDERLNQFILPFEEVDVQGILESDPHSLQEYERIVTEIYLGSSTH